MKLKAAVIGVGYLGQFHAQKLKAHPDVELIGVCDAFAENANKVATSLQVQAFADPKDLIGKVDYVHVAASTQAHYDIGRLMLENRIPVLIEKPIAATLQQAEALCELAARTKTKMTVGHLERFNPAFTFFKTNVKNVSYLEMNRLAPFRVRGSDVSVMHDLTIHDLDLVNWLFESEIESFEATGAKLIKPTYDDVSVRLKLKSGVEITINNSRVNPSIIRNFRAIGKNESYFVNTATLEVEVLKVQAMDPFHTIEKMTLAKQDALAIETDSFVQSVLHNKPVAVTPEDAFKALQQVEKIISYIDSKSARN